MSLSCASDSWAWRSCQKPIKATPKILDPMSPCYLCMSVTKFSSPEKNDNRAPACWGWFSKAFHVEGYIFILIWETYEYHSEWFLPCSFLPFSFFSGTLSFLVLYFPGHHDPQSCGVIFLSTQPSPFLSASSWTWTQDLFHGFSSSPYAAQTALPASRVLRPLLAPSAYDPRAGSH